MTESRLSEPWSSNRAGEIARQTLAGNHDLLLACRELDDLRTGLSGVPDDIMDTFVGVAEEVSDLPIGPERQHWAPEALKRKDIEAANYRELVRVEVTKALQQLLVALDKGDTQAD